MTDIADYEFLVKINGYKVKLDSLNELKTLIGSIHDRHLTTKTAIDILRGWVERVRGIHPKLDVYINTLNYFEPVSESVASRWKAHTVDTQDSVLGEWAQARYIRKITELKMDNGLKNNTNASYETLNDSLKRNLPKELHTIPGKPDPFYGDSYYNTLFLKSENMENLIDSTLQTVLGDAERLINYLHPVNTFITVTDEMFEIKIEAKDITINKIGDKKYVIADTIDDTILIPISE